MSWTYEATSGLSSKDKVRLLTGQTSSADDVLLSDEELQYILSEASGTQQVRRAAIFACGAIAARYGVFPNRKAVGKLNLTWADRAEAYRTRAEELREELTESVGISPYIGGISISDMRIDETDTNRPKPRFALGMFNNPGTDPGSTGAFST